MALRHITNEQMKAIAETVDTINTGVIARPVGLTVDFEDTDPGEVRAEFRYRRLAEPERPEGVEVTFFREDGTTMGSQDFG